MQLKSVVFPAPFGPMRPTISPAATSNDTSEFAASPPKNLLTCLISSSGMTSPEKPGDSFGHVADDDDDENPVDQNVRVREVLLQKRARLRLLADDSRLHQRVRDRVAPQGLRQRDQEYRADHRTEDRADAADDRDHHDLNGQVESEDGARIDEADVD